MKKVLCILLSMLMIISVFSGCMGEPGPLRIVVDMQVAGANRMNIEVQFYDIVGTLYTNDKIGEYEVEFLPPEGAEREAALDRIRTEIMTGDGPDVFIMNCIGDDYINSSVEMLFPIPEKTMEAGYFLPLDEYIENAEYGEWENFRDVILDAGRNEEGLQIVPLAYTLPIAAYRKGDVAFSYSKETTWEDIMSDENLFHLTAPLADGEYRSYSVVSGPVSFSVNPHINYVLGDLADFENEELNFTEEELLARVQDVLKMKAYVKEKDLNGTPGWYEDYLGRDFDKCYLADKNGIYPEGDEISLLPICSDDGGVTATVTAYAAVNRNTRHAEEAFRVIDRMMYHQMMTDSWFYHYYIYTYGDQGAAIPMNDVLFSERKDRSVPMYNNPMYMEPQKQEEFYYVLDNITHAEFSDSLHTQLEDMMYLAARALDEEGLDEEKLKETVHRYYEILERMMAE